MKESSDGKDTNASPSCSSPCVNGVNAESKYKSLNNICSDPFAIHLKNELNRSIYGSVTKDIEDLRARRIQLLSSLPCRLDFSTESPKSGLRPCDLLGDKSKEVSPMMDKQKSHFTSKEIIDLEDDCVLIDSLAVEDSKSVCKPSAQKTPGYICNNGLSVNAPVNDLRNCKNGPVVIVDLDDEEENAEPMGPEQVSEDNLEALNFEIPPLSQSQGAFIKDLVQDNSLSTHFSRTSHEVQSDKQDNSIHMAAESVQHAVDYAIEYASQSASTYNEVALNKPNDGKPIKISAVSFGHHNFSCVIRSS